MTRKLDAAIAEALGYEVIKPRFQDMRDLGGYLHKNVDMWTGDFPYYSNDGNAMLELIWEAQNEGYNFFIQKINNQQYIASFLRGILSKVYRGYSNTMPEAVAKAFYKAKTGKEWRDDYTESRRRKDNAGD
jgi:hypothetical protein